MNEFEISKDDMCILCRERAGKAERGVFPLLNMEQEAELIQNIADEYQRRGVSGPMCRRCARLPVVTT